MFCNNCGIELADSNQKFCPNCGFPLNLRRTHKNMKFMVLDKNANIINTDLNKKSNRVSILAMLATLSFENLINRNNLGELEEFSVRTQEGYLNIFAEEAHQVLLLIQYGTNPKIQLILNEFRPQTPRVPPDVIYAGWTPEVKTPPYELPNERINLKDLIKELEDKYYSKVQCYGSKDDKTMVDYNKEHLDALLTDFIKMLPDITIVMLMDKNANILSSNFITTYSKEESYRISILAMIATLSLKKLSEKLNLGEIDLLNIKTQRGYLMITPVGNHQALLIWIDDPSPRLGIIALEYKRLREKIKRIETAAYKTPDEEFNLKKLLQELEDKFYSYKKNSFK
ncbi:MAG: roadblock/LC7 domain-containing protein [Promethearchaeota archaeon]